MKDFLTGLIVFVIALLFSAVIGLLFGWVVTLLWNWIIPDIFGLTTITYWHGVGLLWLSGILFRSSNTATKQS